MDESLFEILPRVFYRVLNAFFFECLLFFQVQDAFVWVLNVSFLSNSERLLSSTFVATSLFAP